MRPTEEAILDDYREGKLTLAEAAQQLREWAQRLYGPQDDSSPR